MDENAFGLELRRLRKAKGMSGLQLSKEVGLNQSYLSKVERGVNPPPAADNIIKIAGVLGEDPDRLLEMAGRSDPNLSRMIAANPVKIAPAIRILGELDEGSQAVASAMLKVFIALVSSTRRDRHEPERNRELLSLAVAEFRKESAKCLDDETSRQLTEVVSRMASIMSNAKS